MVTKPSFATRHLVSINDLTNRDIEIIFEVAQGLLKDLPDPRLPYRIGRSTKISENSILASLFYEPSTRTRLSFESAMLRLGGNIITSADPTTSSAAKGESLADSVRVVSNYADVIVIRHPRDGAARLAAEYATVPVINGGDGGHEHPTQTLCDIFTLKRKNRSLKNLNVAIAGDLKGSRTIHSFVYALARFGAHIVPLPAAGMELPEHVDRRLREEYNCDFDHSDTTIGALYRTPDEPHQPTLFPQQEFELTVSVAAPNGPAAHVRHKESGRIGAVYVTRFQKERWTEQQKSYPKIDANFLNEPKYAHASVMHPLPRVGELDVSLDSDVRAAYFEQAAYGVPIRMALIGLLLGQIKGKSLDKYESGFRPADYKLYEQPLDVGIRCINANCIVHEASEAPYVRNKFFVIKTKGESSTRLRCVYCEADIEHFSLSHRKHLWYSDETHLLSKIGDLRDVIAFKTMKEAQQPGYHARRHAERPAKTSAKPKRRAKA